MNYFVIRDGEPLGPFSLQELQQKVREGIISLTEEVRGEGADQWMPENPMLVRQVLAGQLQADQSFGIPLPQQIPSGPYAGPLPPRLHWALLLVLIIASGGIFSLVWMFVQARFVRKIDPPSPALWWFVGGTAIVMLGGIVVGIDAALSTSQTIPQTAVETSGAFALVQLLSLIVFQIGYFSIRRSLEIYYTRVENIHLQLSGRMTLLFNIIYFQYHFNRIRRWRLTGTLS